MIIFDLTIWKYVISNITIAFKITDQKYQNKLFLVSNLQELLHLKNLNALVSNMLVVFFKFQPKKIQIRHFCSQIHFLSFCMKLYILKNSRMFILNLTIGFQNDSLEKKYLEKVFLVPNLKLFWFIGSFALWKVWRCYYQL